MSDIKRATQPKTERGNDASDHRDDPQYLERATLTPLEAEASTNAGTPPPPCDLVFTDDELSAARLTPKCIVRNYLYADVATLVAPGGTGKTTLALYEMINIALGWDVHGLKTEAPGWCLFVTAEDRREQLAARLREILRELPHALHDDVLARVLIWDVSGEAIKLVKNFDGNVELTRLADDIVEAYRDNPPVMVTFDPVVSFGASEGQINDNEQAIITAARRMVRGLDCCVRLIAHTGKAVAREKGLDQYASRGGSALSDGARMVSVLAPWTPGDTGRTPPSGCIADDRASLTILARPKLSYGPPNPPLIWVRRHGWKFESFTETKLTPQEADRELFDRVEKYLADAVRAGHRHTKSTLETEITGTPRKDARRAIAQLITRGRIIERDLPADERQGRRKTYLTTSAEYGGIAQTEQKGGSENG